MKFDIIGSPEEQDKAGNENVTTGTEESFKSLDSMSAAAFNSKGDDNKDLSEQKTWDRQTTCNQRPSNSMDEDTYTII